MKKFLNNLLRITINSYTLIGVSLLVIATVLIISPFYPYIWFSLNNQSLTEEQNNVTQVKEIISQNKKEKEKDIKNALPPLDTSLTKVNTLLIHSIGVVAEIHENPNSSKGLEKGTWRVNDWGDPINNNYSIILASHRFGYLTWSPSFRKLNSFESLPKTKVGDRISIIWEQRLYNYEIYKGEVSTKITDYNADLILYTCVTFNSQQRIFRYAKRI